MTLTGTVTVLFTDVVASTEMMARLGDDAGERLLIEHFVRLRDIVAANGGHEVKRTGDGLMAVFNSAVSAVECAVDMQQRIEWQNRSTDGAPVALRVGLHAGEAIPTEGDYYGVAVVVARRLCDAARAGEILASQLVIGLVGSRPDLHLRPVGELELKGIAGPVVATAVEWPPLADVPVDEQGRILVVDDQEANVMLLEKILQRGRFTELRTTTDARQALPLFLSFRPDLLLLDLHMPHLDGFAVMEQIRRRVPADDYVPILVLTADVTPEAKQRALAAGAKDFVTKPFDPSEVTLRVKNLLETRALHLRLQDQNARLERAIRERTRDLEDAHIDVLHRLARAAEIREDPTGDHVQRVGDLTASLAGSLGLASDLVELYRRAAQLHDVGKAAISDRILSKPGALTGAEMDVVKQHTLIGTQLLAGGRHRFLQLAEEIALTHHERWDGLGYSGLSGAAIPLAGRIVAVADAFDAMTHDRPYRAAMSVDAARAEVSREAGRQFDPKIAEALLALDDVAAPRPP